MDNNLQPDHIVKAAMDKVLEMAKSNGVSGADVIASQGSSMSFKSSGGKLDEYKISGGQVLGIRVVKDNKVGLAYSESLDDQALDYMVNTAISNSAFSKENQHERISSEIGGETLSIDDEFNQSETVDVKDQIEFTLALESEVLKKDKRVRNAPYNGLTKSQSALYIGNTNNRFCYHTEKNHSCYTSALMTEGDKNAMHYDVMIARRFQDLNLAKIVNESVLHAANFLTAKSIPSGKYDVVFSPEIWHQLFGNFQSVYSAKGAQEQLNPWREKLATQVMDKRINITDDPTDRSGSAFTLFDSEGFETSPLDLINEGVLQSFYHNTATADFFKTKSTGHAARGPKSGLGVSGTNIKIAAGTDSDASIKDGKYFEIVAIQGLGSGSDVMSGDFSFAASGYLKDGSETVQSVKEVTVSGNFYELMLNQVGQIGNTIQKTYDETFFSPLIKFKDMTVAG